LSEVIKAAKKTHYNKLFICSKKKVKTMWNLVKSKTNKQGSNNELPLNMEGKTVTSYHKLANTFNNYFVNATHSIQVGNLDDAPSALDNLNITCPKSFP
jgi:hypothetical protein